MTSYQSAKEEIKRAADIVEFISQFIQLKKAGRNYIGLCPFHSERDPSFTVSPERQTFHCFGCKKGGDIFTFWMEYHGSTFPEALRGLAERYQVTISEGFSSDAQRKESAMRDALFRINEAAAKYFQKVLNHPVKGKAAKDYLSRRSISMKVSSEFRLGYAPDEWDGLTGALINGQANLNVAAQAGLIIPRRSGGYYDRFRNRIIFPILDLRQQVIGFGGRVLDNSLPKYLNTPETPIFHKGESLYGLHAAHKIMRDKGRAVIVEGYMDCLALIRHGLGEVVATLGTALTPRQVRKIKGYAAEAVIVFDSDEAGRTAVLKSLPIFLNEGLSARAVVLPGRHDPDSFVNARGLDSFLDLMERGYPIFDFFLDQKLPARKHFDIEEKVRVLGEVLPVLGELRNETQRALYVRHLAEKLGMKEETIMTEFGRVESGPSGKVGRGLRESLAASEIHKNTDELRLLNLLIHHPHSGQRLMNSEWRVIFSSSAVVEIVEAFFDKIASEETFPPENLLDYLEKEDSRILFREALYEPSFYDEKEVEQAVADIEKRIYQTKISKSIKKVRQQGNVDPEVLNRLLKLKSQGPVKQ